MSKKSIIFILLILHFLNLPAHENVDKVRSDFSFYNIGQLVEIQDNNSNQKNKLNTYQAIVLEDPYMKFDRLTKKNGLSSNYILDIFQDKFGFMWIATIKGLNRYDGHHFKQYFHTISDTVSIADDLVTCLKEDQEGNLWVGTRKGLNKYNRANDSFKKVITINEQGDTSEIDDYIRAILPDENNILWIETATGDLIKYNYISESSAFYHHASPSMVDTYFYHDLYKDEEGNLWLGGRFMGIYKFNPETEEFYLYGSDENDNTKKRENDVASYFQDSKSTMWLGGIDGLYTLETQTEICTKVLPISTFCVVEDSHEKLWFGTGSGIYIYNLMDNSFSFMNKDDNNPQSLIQNHVNKIYIDAAQNVWIGTIDGISIFRPSKNKFRHVFHIPGDERTPISSNVTSILQLKSDEIWIGTDNSGIDCMTKQFIKTDCYNKANKDNNKLSSNRISVLMQDTEGDVWAGQWSGRGFDIISPKTNVVKSFSFLDNSLKADWYNDIFEDTQGNMWMGIWGASGLYQFDKERGIFKDQTFQLKHGIPQGAVKNLLYDGDNIWIGFQNQSIFYALNPITRSISNYLKDMYSSYGFNQIFDVFKDGNNDIWFETNKGFFHKQKDPYISIVPGENLPGNRSENIDMNISVLDAEYGIDTVLCKLDDDENTWIGTYKGLFKISENKVIQHYSVKTHMGLISDTIWSMAFVPTFQIWLGTEKGLCELDIRSEIFEAFVVDKKSYLSSHLIKCISEDMQGRLWVGTTNMGLNQLDPFTGVIRQYNSNLDDEYSFWGELVNCIYIDKTGAIWIGAYGLNKYNSESDTFSHYIADDGLADNDVMSILEDDDGKLWITTLNGLSVFDPVAESFENYDEKDGLQDNEFTNAAYKLKSGVLAFGGKNGISICNPSNFFVNAIPPELSIISFSVFDKKLDIEMAATSQIELNYNENYFSIEYIALDFSNPECVQYAYKLENADKDWIYVDANSRIAKYTNIDPGSYRFWVKASNGDNIWNQSGIFIDLIITPPFWKTTWFILFEIVILVLIVIFIIKYREKKIIEKNQFQLLEQKLLRSQMNPHFIFNSLSSIQSFIFENNPLEAGSYLSRFAELIRSILYNSREEFITLEKEIKTLQNYLELQQLRYNNKFDYILDVDPLIQADMTQIPPMLAQPFIENAIEHGIKHLKGRGFVSVSFTLMPKNESILLLVEDNGIGLKASKRLKSDKPKSHTSLATVIANERIDIFNKGRKKKQFIMEIGEMKGGDGKTTGTKVKFIIPYREL